MQYYASQCSIVPSLFFILLTQCCLAITRSHFCHHNVFFAIIMSYCTIRMTYCCITEPCCSITLLCGAMNVLYCNTIIFYCDVTMHHSATTMPCCDITLSYCALILSYFTFIMLYCFITVTLLCFHSTLFFHHHALLFNQCFLSPCGTVLCYDHVLLCITVSCYTIPIPHFDITVYYCVKSVLTYVII